MWETQLLFSSACCTGFCYMAVSNDKGNEFENNRVYYNWLGDFKLITNLAEVINKI